METFSHKGFALAEAVIAIAVVSIASVLLAATSKQFIGLSNESKKTGALMELRSKQSSMMKNPELWLTKLRSSPNSAPIVNACMSNNGNELYNCPPNEDDTLLVGDSDLRNVAPGMHVSSLSLVDALGQPLAGTVAEPLYLNVQGRPCDDVPAETKCAFKSTGYLFRTTPAGDPGAVKFVAKIESNSANRGIASGGAPIKPLYLSMDVADWKKATGGANSSNGTMGSCPSPSIQVGYLKDGTPSCLDPTTPCAAGKISVGVDSLGKSICTTLPTTTCTAGSMALEPTTKTISCVADSPCVSPEVFLGYYAGTGKPQCLSSTSNCQVGEVPMGSSCKVVPTCKIGEKLSYNGNNFLCQAPEPGHDCPSGSDMTGLDASGLPVCKERSATSCPAGQYMTGLDKAGLPQCAASASGACPAGQVVTGINQADGTKICTLIGAVLASVSCPDGYVLRGFNTNGTQICIPAFGGVYETHTSGECRYVNTITGACSCPAGTSPKQFNEWQSGEDYHYADNRAIASGMYQYLCLP